MKQRLSRNRIFAILVFIIMFVGIVLSGSVFINNFKKNYQHQVINQLDAISNLKADELTNWRKERLAEAAFYQTNSDLCNLISQYNSDTANVKIATILEKWFYKTAKNHGYEVFLINKQGFAHPFYTQGSLKLTDAIIDQVNTISEQGKISFLDFYFEKQNGKLMMGVVIPLLQNNQGSTIFWCIDPETYIFPMLKKWPIPSATAESFLIRTVGDSIQFLTNELFHHTNSRHITFFDKNLVMPVSSQTNSFAGLAEGVDPQGVKCAAFFRPVNGTPWVLVSRIQSSEIYAPINKDIRMVYLIILTLVIIAALIFTNLWRRETHDYYKNQYYLEKNLVESRNQFKLFMDYLPALVFIKDQTSKITFINNYMDKLLGASQWLGKNPTQLFTPDDAQYILENDKRVFETGYEKNIETFHTAQGEGRKFETIKFAIQQQNKKKILGAIAIDITERIESEQELIRLNQRLSLATETANIGIWELNLETQFLAWNDIMFHIYNQNPTDFGSGFSDWAQRLHPADKKRAIEEFENGVKAGSSFFSLFRILMPNGTVKHIESHAVIRLSDANKPISVVGINIDVTQSTLAKQNLLASEYRFRILFDKAPIAYQSLNLEGEFLDVNIEWCNMLGYDKKEVIGHYFREFLTPESAIRMTDGFTLLSTNGEVQLNFEMYHKSGAILNIRLRGSVGYELDGAFKQAHCILIDETSRLKSQKLLRDSEKNYRLLIENMNEGVVQHQVVYNEQGVAVDYRILSVNKGFEQQLGILASDVVGKLSTEAYNVKQPPFFDLYLKVAQGGESAKFTSFFDKMNRYFSISVSSPRVNYFVTIFEDITDRTMHEKEMLQLNETLETRVKQRTEELELTNKELKTFAFSVSHDLRAPLRAIDGYSLMLIEDYAKNLDDNSLRMLEVIRTNAKKMDALITDLLSLSRVTQNALKISHIDMSTMANSMFHEQTNQQERDSIKIIINQMPKTYADTGLIRQVWANYISNAVKYSSQSKEPIIEIGGYSQSDKVVYYVKDNGVGFDPEYKSKLFGAFQRLHPASEFEGNGIGLAIVQRIIVRHGGEVWAEGDIDKGATFYFSLPLTPVVG